jgi:hypothetical protein
MLRRWFDVVYAGFWVAVIVSCSLFVSGCSDVGDFFGAVADLFHTDASAQGDRTIETFVIDTNTFRLATDEPPMIEVKDGSFTTVYTMGVGDATVTVGNEERGLDEGDVVIERIISDTQSVVTVLSE